MKYLLIALLLVGCGANPDYETMLQSNQLKIVKLKVGMSKQEVLTFMGEQTVSVRKIMVSNPFKSTFRTKDKDTVEVLYYLTRKAGFGNPVAEEQSTPIVLKNDKVVGWGFDALEK